MFVMPMYSASLSRRSVARALLALAALSLAVISAPALSAASSAQGASGQRELTVDALSVVKIKSHAVRGARSSASLGAERQGTGIVIDTKGLVLTIGYLITEAESIWLTSTVGGAVPATVIGYDQETGFGLVQALGRLNVPPLEIGASQRVGAGASVLGRRGADRRRWQTARHRLVARAALERARIAPRRQYDRAD